MGFISDFVSRKVEEATIKNTKSVSRKVVGKIYGKAAGKVTESIYNKTLTKIDESNNEKMVIGSQEELLARNPQNSKLIFLPQDSELKIQDRDGRQKYRIYQAVFLSRTWNLFGEKSRKIASVKEKRRGILKRLFLRKRNPKDFTLKSKGENIGTLKTLNTEDMRIGTTNFNNWRVENDQVFDGDRCVAALRKVKSWTDVKYVLDFSKELDEIIVVLVLFSMRKADEDKESL